ncbi:MAG: Gfo/Idh/MocA family oxidoreductase [Ilumatobacteraceae bacterium]
MRVGLIGTAFGVGVHLPGYRLVPGIEVVAICSAQLSRAAAAAEQHGIPSFTDDYATMVQRDDIDLVDVCTPADSHHPITLAAIAAGKAVLCEKPLASDAAQAVDMVDAAASSGVVNAVTHEFRYMPVRRHIRQLVRDGYVGDIHFVNASVFADYALNPSMEPHYHTWVSMRAEGGGVVNGLLSHHIDLLRFSFGDLHDVGGATATMITEKPVLPWEYRDGDPIGPETETIGMKAVDADDAAVVHAKLANGAPVVLTGSWSVHHGSGVRLEVYGRDGTLILDNTGTLHGGRTGEPLAEIPIPASVAVHHADAPSPLVSMFAMLAEDIAAAVDGAPPPAGDDHLFAQLADGLAVQQVIDRVSPMMSPDEMNGA